MKAGAECGGCLAGLAEKIALASSGGDASLFLPAKSAAERALRDTFREGESVPTRIATGMLRAVSSVTGKVDLFHEAKLAEYERGRVAAKTIKEHLGDDLAALCALAAAGNRLDFFRDLALVEKEWRSSEHGLVVDDSAAFALELEAGGPLLFLADNAGELPFDLPLLHALRARGIETVYAVKGLPSQNDLTREDMRRFSVSEEGVVDTGTDWVGCELAETGEEFKHAWARSRVVFSKGMANLETLTEYPEALCAKRVFFALVAKCAPVAALLGAEQGGAVIFDGRRLFGS